MRHLASLERTQKQRPFKRGLVLFGTLALMVALPVQTHEAGRKSRYEMNPIRVTLSIPAEVSVYFDHTSDVDFIAWLPYQDWRGLSRK